jgi:hypothetical protein
MYPCGSFSYFLFILLLHNSNMITSYISPLIFLYLVQGRILTVAGVTAAVCSTPFVGFLNLAALAVWPDWMVVAICETLRKVVFYDLQTVLASLIKIYNI